MEILSVSDGSELKWNETFQECAHPFSKDVNEEDYSKIVHGSQLCPT